MRKGPAQVGSQDLARTKRMWSRWLDRMGEPLRDSQFQSLSEGIAHFRHLCAQREKSR